MTTFSTAKTGCIGTTILCWFNPMKLRLIGCTVLILSMPCFGQSGMERRLECLAMVETGGNDSSVGRDGERSRYQITPAVWREYTSLPMSSSTNPLTARAVVVKIMDKRLKGRVVTDSQWYLTYHRPERRNHPKPIENDRALRFQNLCQSKTTN